MADERQVKATLEVQRTGDETAFARTADEIERVKATADGAAPSLGSLGDASARAGKETEGLGKATEEAAQKSATFTGRIGELSQALNSKLRAIAQVTKAVAGMWAAWEVGYSVGTKIREGFNWLTDGQFDRVLQETNAGMLGLGNRANFVAEEVERLKNVVNILQKNGFDTLRMSVEEIEAAYENLIAEQRKVKDELSALEKSFQSWIEKTGLSEKALDRTAKQLVFFAEQLKKAHAGMSDADIAQALGRQLDDVIRKYELLGLAVPASLQKIQAAAAAQAEAVEKASGRVVKAADAQREALARAAEEIVRQIQPVGQSLSEMAAAWELALQKIDFSALTGEQLLTAHDLIQQLVDDYRAAGEQIPPAIEAAADATGVFLAAIERTVDKGAMFAGAATDMAGSALEVTREVDAAGMAVYRISEAAGVASGALTEAGSALGEAGAAAGATTPEMEEVLAKWRELKQAAGDAGDAVGTAGGQIAQGSQEAGSGAEEILKAADAGQEAGEGMRVAGEAASGLAEAMSSASTSAASIADVLTTIQAPSEAAATAMGEIRTAAEGLAEVNLSGLVAQLNAVAAAAREAAAALDQVEGVEGGA
ncbi:MAG: hypothetical protein QM311_01585 [Acidobacteriota bacterium]|nr:hypothetical protein [Acidobacteriota bacterium]